MFTVCRTENAFAARHQRVLCQYNFDGSLSAPAICCVFDFLRRLLFDFRNIATENAPNTDVICLRIKSRVFLLHTRSLFFFFALIDHIGFLVTLVYRDHIRYQKSWWSLHRVALFAKLLGARPERADKKYAPIADRPVIAKFCAKCDVRRWRITPGDELSHFRSRE